MSVHSGWEQRPWGGAPALREERSRARRRLRVITLIAAIFVYALLQVRVSTQVASVGSRISTKQAEVKRLEVDLAVAEAELAQRQIYGELIRPAEIQGFGPGGEYRTIQVVEWNTPEPLGVTQQLEGDLARGVEFLLPAALAQEVLSDNQAAPGLGVGDNRTPQPKDRNRADRSKGRSRAIQP